MIDSATEHRQAVFTFQLIGATADRQNMGDKKPTAIQKSNFSK